MAGRGYRDVVLPVRALDGRTTTVRLPAAAATVKDLRAALRASFPPAQAAPAFHLFLRGGNLLLGDDLSNLSLSPDESISIIPYTARHTTTPAPPRPGRTTPATPCPGRSTPAPTPMTPWPGRSTPAPTPTSPWPGRSTPTPAPTPNPPPPRTPFASAKKRKFFESSWRGEDIYAKVAGVPNNDPTSPSFYCHGEQPLSAAAMFSHLEQGLGKHGQIKHFEEIPGREASFRPLPPRLSPATRDALGAIGVTKLYSHQAEAIDHALAGGKHVVVSTSTSSGKSLCYNVPVLESISPPASTSCALYLFPTKALAQDQLKTLLEMTNNSALNSGDVAIYDGDTPMKDRAKIRGGARLLITNPDMLHVSILPCHSQFARILSNLEHVVIDEAHSYKGAFGCHTALILRRLKRVCAEIYGSHPKFIFCTATLANPREHVMELAGLDDVELVHNDGSPCGSKLFLLWNPSVARAKERRPSPVQEVSYLFAEMVQHGLRCIAFCNTRKLCEMVLARTREILEETSPELADTICVYRGGYVAEDRRKIEADLFGGKLRGVASTNALELGIDVGNIDATLHLGFPGSIASFWQQAGRAGRRSKQSIAVYVGFEGALDQYFMNFPQNLFGEPVEHCQVDSQNQKVLGQHLVCAAFEKPLCTECDERYFGSGMKSVMLNLKEKGCLSLANNNEPEQCSGVWKYAGPDKSPSRAVSIRAIEHDRYKVIDSGGYRVLEEIEESRAFFQVYEGAVYMHQGCSYLVERLDLSSKTAYCRVADHLKYYTKVRDHTEISVHEGDISLPDPRSALSSKTAQANSCKVTTEWVSFDRIWKSNHQLSDSIKLDVPPYSFDTQAAWPWDFKLVSMLRHMLSSA
nr:unnamed protein product [Digitaria exilis]